MKKYPPTFLIFKYDNKYDLDSLSQFIKAAINIFMGLKFCFKFRDGGAHYYNM